MVSYTELQRGRERQANLATAFAINGVDWAAKVISIGALAGLTTVVMVLVLGPDAGCCSRCRATGCCHAALARTGTHGTPVRITVIVGVAVAVAATVFPIGKLEEMVNVGTLFAFVLVSAGVIILRRTRPDLERGFRVPFVPVLPILSIVACVWLMLNLTGLTWIRFVHLDGHRRGHLLRLRPAALGARPAGRRQRPGRLQKMVICLDGRQISLYSQHIK